MALADICGLSHVTRRNDMSMDALQSDMMMNSCNIENNYQLAMPPYSNVRLLIDDFAIYFLSIFGIFLDFNLNFFYF